MKAWETDRLSFFRRPETVGTLFMAGLLLAQIFVRPHGVVNDGTFNHVIHPFGIQIWENGPKSTFFTTRFRLLEHGTSLPAFTSQSLLIGLSVVLCRLFLHDVYDLRFLAAFFMSIYLADTWGAIYLMRRAAERFVPSRSGDRGRGWVVWAATAGYLFIFGDFHYLLYFNSFFTQPAFFVFCLAYLVTAACCLAGVGRPSVMLALCIVSAALMIDAQPGCALLGLGPVLFLLRLAVLKRASGQRRRLFMVLAAVMLLFSSAAYWLAGVQTSAASKYHRITLGIMPYETDAQKLKKLNLPPQLLMLRGTSSYDEYPVILPDAPLLTRQLYSRITPATIAAYYLANSNQFLQMADVAVRSSYVVRQGGSYPASSGKSAAAQSSFFCGWGWLKQTILPKTLGFVLIVCFVLAVGLAALYLRCRKAGLLRERLAIEFLWSLELMDLLAFVQAVSHTGEAGFPSYLFCFSLLFDALLGLAALATAGGLARSYIIKKH